MKFLALLFFVFGIVYLVVGFSQLKEDTKDTNKRVEYRFVPRSVYDDIGLIEVSTNYKDIFEGEEVTYNRRNIPTNLI